MQIQLKKVFQALHFRTERLTAITFVHRFVQFIMRFDENRRHRDRIVKIGQRTFREVISGVQYRLRLFFNSGNQSIGGLFRPRKIVVNNIL